MPVSKAIIVLGNLRLKMTLLAVIRDSSLVKIALKKSSIAIVYLPNINDKQKTTKASVTETTMYAMVLFFIRLDSHH